MLYNVVRVVSGQVNRVARNEAFTAFATLRGHVINSKKQLKQFLAEDIGSGDITSALLRKTKIRARIISREDATIAGAVYAKEIFKLKGCKVKIEKKDGSKIKPKQTLMTITGDAASILTCERTALNLLTRMSGIATGHSF